MLTSDQIITSKYLIFYKNFNGNQHFLKELLTSTEYHLKHINIDILKDCMEAKSVDLIQGKYGSSIIQDYLSKKLLLNKDMLWKQTNLQSIEIEVNNNCNYRCNFCPVSITPPRDNKVMPLELFNEILEKADQVSSMKYVSLSSYNEPLLDPYFEQRIRLIANTKLKLQLSTNASQLSSDVIKILSDSKIIDFIKINIPSVEEAEYTRLTGTSTENFSQVVQNIESAIDAGLNVKFSVNGTKQEIVRNLSQIQEKYNKRITDKIVPVRTMDRAGILNNEYFQNVSIEGRLTGWCFRPLIWVLVSVKGDLYLCSNDYTKKYIYGNIKEGNIEEIINKESSQAIRKHIYGETLPDDDFICRKCEYMARGLSFQRYNPLKV